MLARLMARERAPKMFHVRNDHRKRGDFGDHKIILLDPFSFVILEIGSNDLS